MSKAKRQTYTQVRQGKHYQCAECNAWCGDEIRTVEARCPEQYCGRYADKYKTIARFCSVNHRYEYKYKKSVRDIIPFNIIKATEYADGWKHLYRLWLKEEQYQKEEINPHVVVKALTKMITWLTAYEHTEPYLRLENKFKVLKLLGDALEDYNKEDNVMSELCYYIKLVTNMPE